MMHDELGLEAVTDDEDDEAQPLVVAGSPATSSRNVSPSINVRGMNRRSVAGGAPPAPPGTPADAQISRRPHSVASLRARLAALLTLRDHWIAGLYCFASFMFCGSIPLLGFCVVLPFSDEQTTLFGSSVALT